MNSEQLIYLWFGRDGCILLLLGTISILVIKGHWLGASHHLMSLAAWLYLVAEITSRVGGSGLLLLVAHEVLSSEELSISLGWKRRSRWTLRCSVGKAAATALSTEGRAWTSGYASRCLTLAPNSIVRWLVVTIVTICASLV